MTWAMTGYAWIAQTSWNNITYTLKTKALEVTFFLRLHRGNAMTLHISKALIKHMGMRGLKVDDGDSMVSTADHLTELHLGVKIHVH